MTHIPSTHPHEEEAARGQSPRKSVTVGNQAATPSGTRSGSSRQTKAQVLRTWQLRIFLMSWVGYAAYYFPRNAFSAAKVGIRDQGGLSRETLGMLDSVYLAAYAVGQFLWGAVAERYGARGHCRRDGPRGRSLGLHGPRASGLVVSPADDHPGPGSVHRLGRVQQEHRVLL
ncbi:hypothetical protein [Rothia uropygialis]|uniref:hypothetical protein n=1 Tax=Kocuria sp. 36 TaxID=1415402 RepID=UPI001EE8DC77|nr:hypothetical protein [Kocuria sp. 36]